MDFKGLKLFSLTRSVGNMMDNDEEDVTGVKNALFALGHRKEPAQNGIIDQETDDAIRSFQREKGLKVDGILKPGGETEDALRKAVKPQQRPIVNLEKDREKSLLDDTPALFEIEKDPKKY